MFIQIDKVVVIASAFIQNQNGEVLLLQRSNKASYPHFWQLVEGKLDTGESPEKAIAREVNEETQASVTQLEFNSVFYNEIEAKGLKYLCFRIAYKTKTSSINVKLSDEHLSFGWFNKSDAMKLQLLPGTETVLDKLMS